ncbi:MAG: alpha/beta fold hydrolase [Acidobacteria bacterium]|nr:alpha/beta fold hydrolase [Acidobacteriota bacterium]
MRHIFYLHGFASSAQSTKAAFFARRLRPHGLTLRCPDFNEPDFETLTASRMIAQVEAELAALPQGPVALIGSSLGGFVAFHVAVRQAAERGRARTATRPIDRLVLLAPAFDFGRTAFSGMAAEDVARWRDTDRHEVFHYGENRPRVIRYAIYADAQTYNSAACALAVPTLIFQGTGDSVVDPAMVRAFAGSRPAMSVRAVDDDHLLMSSLDLMWTESAAFLGLPESRSFGE